MKHIDPTLFLIWFVTAFLMIHFAQDGTIDYLEPGTKPAPVEAPFVDKSSWPRCTHEQIQGTIFKDCLSDVGVLIYDEADQCRFYCHGYDIH